MWRFEDSPLFYGSLKSPWLVVLLPIFVFFFSSETARFIFKSDLLPEFESYRVGSIISLPESENVHIYAINGQTLTHFAKSNSYIGGVPLSLRQVSIGAATRPFTKRRSVIEWAWAPARVLPTDQHTEHLELPEELQRKLAAIPEDQETSQRNKWSQANSLFEGSLDPCWKLPLNSRIISRFASPRRISGQSGYYHTGIDLRAAAGTLIRAPQGGRVVFADEMAITGKMVGIYHGSGIVTKYAHLQSIAVKEWDWVERDQLIGHSGNTGRSTGPHLHWEVSWRGTPLDPQEFLRFVEPICDPK